jgi:hypothetical protein
MQIQRTADAYEIVPKLASSPGLGNQKSRRSTAAFLIHLPNIKFTSNTSIYSFKIKIFSSLRREKTNTIEDDYPRPLDIRAKDWRA